MIAELIGLASLIAVNAGINIGIYKYFGNRLDKLTEDNDKKINRIFERFDEHKKDMENCYVRKDVCAVMHQQTADNLSGIEKRINERIDVLQKDVKENFQKLIDVLTKK